MSQISITRKDGITHLVVDGKDVSKNCLGFTLRQDGTNKPQLDITYLVPEISITSDEAEISPKELSDIADVPSPLETVAAAVKSALEANYGRTEDKR